VKLELSQKFIACQLDEYREHFERGNKNALIQAIRFCFNQEIVAPEWVVAEFFRATNRWYNMECKELGEAFGVAWPKGANLNALEKRRRLKFAVLNAVNDARAQGRAIDDLLFEEIGQNLGLGKTLVKEYLQAARAQIEMPSAADALLTPLIVPGHEPEPTMRTHRKGRPHQRRGK